MYFGLRLIFIFVLINIAYSQTFYEIKISDETIGSLNKDYFWHYKNLENITRLEIMSCVINNIENDAFKELTALESLIISNTTIDEISFSIKNLKYLFLNKNSLNTAPNLENFPSLLNLNLADNNIGEINYKLNHGLENLNLSENPLKEVNIALKSLSEITIFNSKYAPIIFKINCPYLNSIDVSEIDIKEEDLNQICKYNNSATIYMRFKRASIMHECSTREDQDDLFSSGELYASKSIETDDEQSVIVENSPNLQEDFFSEFLMAIQNRIGFSPVYLMLATLVSILLIMLLTFILLLRKMRRSKFNDENYHPHIYEKIMDDSFYLSPPRITKSKIKFITF